MNKSTALIFIDESGNHALDPVHIDAQYGVFVLCAVCFSFDEYVEFDAAFRKLKQRLFGTEEYVIHTAEITRPTKSRSEVSLLFEASSFRRVFYDEVNALIAAHSFKVISSVIKKNEAVALLGELSSDPYLYSFEFIINRVLYNFSGSLCKIYPEKRRRTEDAKLCIAFDRYSTLGTQYYKPSEVTGRVPEFNLVDKRENHSGSQLADLIASPIGRNALGKKARPGSEVEYTSFTHKLHTDNSLYFP